MNTCRTAESMDTCWGTRKVTTTLYDLLSGIDSNILGLQREGPGKELMDDNQITFLTEKVDQMFESGQIRFKDPQKVARYFNDIILQ